MKLGAQLYTVRDSTKTLEDFALSLKKVADIGYKSVQVSGTCDFEADWLAEQLKINGLVCPVTHVKPPLRIAEETAKVAADHKLFGCRVVGIGSAPGIWDEGFCYETDFRDRFLPAAQTLRDNGLILGYHNHQAEFVKAGGGNMLERMVSDFPADMLSFILDTYWVQFAGGDPALWIKKLSGRVECIHLKDMSIVGKEQRMAPIGGGNINFDAVLAACESAGTEYLLVEQDNCYDEDPFDCLAQSYEYVRAMGIEG